MVISLSDRDNERALFEKKFNWIYATITLVITIMNGFSLKQQNQF